jgi:hypothetical protein
MSTEYEVFKNDHFTLSLEESSSKFSLVTRRSNDSTCWHEENFMTPERIVDLAMKLLQPTLYNVPDPKTFMENVIKKKLAGLFV